MRAIIGAALILVTTQVSALTAFKTTEQVRHDIETKHGVRVFGMIAKRSLPNNRNCHDYTRSKLINGVEHLKNFRIYCKPNYLRSKSWRPETWRPETWRPKK